MWYGSLLGWALPVYLPALPLVAPQVFDASEPPGVGHADDVLVTEGWLGFANWEFLLHALLALTLAVVFSAAIAYHPRSMRTMDTLEEAVAPRIYLVYGLVGAVIGLMVLEYGLVVGFVVFGIGGLIRFRTTLPSATKTGRLILVTLIGLSMGLNLPHVAFISTAFGFALIYIMDARVTYRIEVKDLDSEVLVGAAHAYREVLTSRGCRILNEKKNFDKKEVAFIFRTSHQTSREDLEQAFTHHLPEKLRGSVDWEMD